jgi:hypothetical protein
MSPLIPSLDTDFTSPATQFVPLVEFLWDEQTHYFSKTPAVSSNPNPDETFAIQAGTTIYRNRRNGIGSRFFFSSARYARSDSDVTVSSESGDVEFTAEPSIEIDLGSAMSVGADSNPAKLRLPVSTYPIDKMATGTWSEVQVNIYDHQPGDGTLRHVYTGYITKVTSRYQGNSLIAEVEFEGLKKRFESVPGGLRLTTLCGWIYGDCNCAAPDKDEYHLCYISTGSNTDIEQNQLGLYTYPDEIFPVGGPDHLSWKINKGWVAKVLDVGWQDPAQPLNTRPIAISGRKFQIKYAAEGTGPMLVIRTVNPFGDWFSEPEPVLVAIYNGCDKTMANCDFGHSNMQRFGGFGMFIPSHNPITDSPT